MFKIKNLSAVYDNQQVVENLSISIKPKQFHVVFGDKESGGNALFQLLAGNDAIVPSHGTIVYNQQSYDQLSIEQRNLMGIFVISVNTPELSGITHYDFVKKVFKLHHPNSTNFEFEEYLRDCYDLLNLTHEYNTELVNDLHAPKFNHIKTELLLMMMCNPQLVIIEDIDAELSTEELEFVANILSQYIKDQSRTCLIFTQNQKFANMLPATHVSLMAQGVIRKRGGLRLLERIIQDEYS
jgi:Fe-S cluster assembly ATPase SufC